MVVNVATEFLNSCQEGTNPAFLLGGYFKKNNDASVQ